MASEKLGSISEVEIDPEGTFKYILIKVYSEPKSSAAEPAKTIVRGFKSGAFHDKVSQRARSYLRAVDYCLELFGHRR
ncbi:unnamed protein product, partial [Timema podura]|nr:unnamed protein product [Timema podura]